MSAASDPARAVPAAVPPASDSRARSSQVAGRNDPLRETNSGVTSDATLAGAHRVSQRALDGIRQGLSERDWQIMRSVDDYRFLTAGHLQTLHFNCHASDVSAGRITRRVLERLRSHRVLGTLSRRIGGIRSGSTGLVYYLDEVGDRLLRADNPARTRQRTVEPSTRFLTHTLAVADATIAIRAASRARGVELVRLTPERGAWRRYQAAGGGLQTLRPDLFAEVAAQPSSDEVTAFFIEIDLGHESLPTLLRKCHAYEQYRRSGSEQAAFGGFPRVLWSIAARTPVTAARRRQALVQAIGHDQQLPDRLFAVTGPDQLAELVTGGSS